MFTFYSSSSQLDFHFERLFLLNIALAQDFKVNHPELRQKT